VQIRAALNKLKPLINVSVKDMGAWQLALFIGLQELHAVAVTGAGAGVGAGAKLWVREWKLFCAGEMPLLQPKTFSMALLPGNIL
jgi:molybdopterin-guanine dinucleotide biosynthesis protein A